MSQAQSSPELHKNLDARLLTMMTLGGSIGTGIFLASGSVLAKAGPGGILVAYLLMGVLVYFLMNSLGEMAAYMPTSGSFYQYAADFVDPSLGYALGWNYWYSWAISIAAEIAASAVLMRFWFPDSPHWIWTGSFLILILGFNAFSTKLFGEIEYWLSLIKVTVIILFIVIGFAMIFGLTSHHSVGLKNWSLGDAPFHDGCFGIFSAFMLAGFSFQGTEMIGIAAGESKDPGTTIPRVIKMVFWRIFIFFFLTMLIIAFLIPYTSAEYLDQNISMSPFTKAFALINHTYAPSFMNAIILIALLSTANSGLYASSRMLWFLAKEKHVPSVFSSITKRGIPIWALLATVSISFFVFITSLFSPKTIYLWLVNAGSLAGFIAWMGISVSHYKFRKQYIKNGNDLRKLPFLAKGFPYAPIGVFISCILMLIAYNIVAYIHYNLTWQELCISYLGLPLFFFVWFGKKYSLLSSIGSLRGAAPINSVLNTSTVPQNQSAEST
ncbi:amino acid permease [Legionella waltersii]|uniref:Amino acid (Lysine) permease n=1 Tax=Legionella waltersii TaxID=66969 RepID=A0A0W1ADF0_9GAMM|nr:amino acid permease [Legionella waltersii]KTD79355.1 amino acid (lysine) permease [Legionella waltersii]SNU99890.1 amino acid (lysine) permease [Legionella waltersii]